MLFKEGHAKTFRNLQFLAFYSLCSSQVFARKRRTCKDLLSIILHPKSVKVSLFCLSPCTVSHDSVRRSIFFAFLPVSGPNTIANREIRKPSHHPTSEANSLSTRFGPPTAIFHAETFKSTLLHEQLFTRFISSALPHIMTQKPQNIPHQIRKFSPTSSHERGYDGLQFQPTSRTRSQVFYSPCSSP